MLRVSRAHVVSPISPDLSAITSLQKDGIQRIKVVQSPRALEVEGYAGFRIRIPFLRIKFRRQIQLF